MRNDEHAWLLDDGSLTRRLTALADGRFRVQPLDEGWQALRDEECTALGVENGSEGWVREVYLLGDEQPWVFARSVAAKAALQAGDVPLQELGTRSLGELLFSDPAFSRGGIELCRYPAGLLPEKVRQPALWARRSAFSRGPLSVLVAEVFLPDFWCRAL
ncbi:chorismate--pyruvate lyase family protein [Stutzerimonas azotifigens]|uniref:chorismate--pyruvate lyase family protein n=1 Tax=Stutzerimonas azotifigens TaxID=291995 RepID=UPI001C61342B|nr:chorismate lyase [Stutzerimonas azotifigens]